MHRRDYLAERHPWSMSFAGQIVSPKQSFWTCILHNQVVFAVPPCAACPGPAVSAIGLCRWFPLISVRFTCP